MKFLIDKQRIFFFIIIIFATPNVFSQKLVSDPALTLAVGTTNAAERKVLKGIISGNNKIAGLNATITYNLNRIKKHEENIYNYLSTISTSVSQAIEIKQAADVSRDIVKSFSTCAKAARENSQGVVYTAIVARKTSKLTTEMAGIYSYISNIALNKKTLLNTVERQMIIDAVLYKLRRIKSEMYLLQFQIENYTLADLPQVLFPEQYFMAIDTKRIANGVIRKIKNK